jgi:hypothetical protein
MMGCLLDVGVVLGINIDLFLMLPIHNVYLCRLQKLDICRKRRTHQGNFLDLIPRITKIISPSS